MGFCMTEPLQERRDPPAKNRVVGSRHLAANRVEQIAPQPLETMSETSVTITITVSGIPCWPNRDPIGEAGFQAQYGNTDSVLIGQGLEYRATPSSPYAFVHNETIGTIDPFGLACGRYPAAPSTFPCTATPSAWMTTNYCPDGSWEQVYIVDPSGARRPDFQWQSYDAGYCEGTWWSFAGHWYCCGTYCDACTYVEIRRWRCRANGNTVRARCSETREGECIPFG